MSLAYIAKLHKVQPTNVPDTQTPVTVELARKGKTTAESVKAWVLLPTAAMRESVTPDNLAPEALTAIVSDWFSTVRDEYIREEARAAYARQAEEFPLELSLAGYYAYWQATATSRRLNSDEIKDWFPKSDVALAMVEKLTAAGKEEADIAAILRKVLDKLCSLAAPVPSLSLEEAERLAPYFVADDSVLGNLLAKKLQSIIKRFQAISSIDAL